MHVSKKQIKAPPQDNPSPKIGAGIGISECGI